MPPELPDSLDPSASYGLVHISFTPPLHHVPLGNAELPYDSDNASSTTPFLIETPFLPFLITDGSLVCSLRVHAIICDYSSINPSIGLIGEYGTSSA